MDSETDFSTDSGYNEFANEILFVGDFLQLFQLGHIFTIAEIQTKKDLADITVQSLTSSYVTEVDAQPVH